MYVCIYMYIKLFVLAMFHEAMLTGLVFLKYSTTMSGLPP